MLAPLASNIFILSAIDDPPRPTAGDCDFPMEDGVGVPGLEPIGLVEVVPTVDFEVGVEAGVDLEAPGVAGALVGVLAGALAGALAGVLAGALATLADTLIEELVTAFGVPRVEAGADAEVTPSSGMELKGI